MDYRVNSFGNFAKPHSVFLWEENVEKWSWVTSNWNWNGTKLHQYSHVERLLWVTYLNMNWEWSHFKCAKVARDNRRKNGEIMIFPNSPLHLMCLYCQSSTHFIRVFRFRNLNICFPASVFDSDLFIVFCVIRGRFLSSSFLFSFFYG